MGQEASGPKQAGGEKKTGKNRRKMEALSYRRTDMQKEMVIRKLRERGCRITRQRLMLIDIILEEECSCCKEIFYRASEKNPGIGPATVYRLVNMLEEIGAIRKRGRRPARWSWTTGLCCRSPAPSGIRWFFPV